MPTDAILQEGQKIEDCEAPHKLWTLEGNTFKAYAVETGTTNGVTTEIVSGINEGTEVLTDMVVDDGTQQEEKNDNPFMPKPKDNKNNKSGGNQQQKK